MSHGAIDPDAENRAGEGGAVVARAGDQQGGSGGRCVARFCSVAASSLSLSRRGSGGRVSTCGRRSLGDDYPQDPEQHCTGVAGLFREQRADHERDRTTRHIGVSVGSAWTWLSGGTSVTSVSNIPLTVCSSPSSNRSIGPSSPIAYGLLASPPRRRPGAASWSERAMKTAAIYARVSSDKQKEENTIASQTAALTTFAAEQGYAVPT